MNLQNQGLGKYILDFVKTLAQKQKLQYIWLGVWERNTSAIRFYKKNDFQIFSSHEFKLGPELQTDVLMKYSIPYNT